MTEEPKRNLLQVFSKNIPLIVFCTTVLLCGILALNTYYINYWPTDSYNPYIPTAARLFSVPYLCQMHKIPVEGVLRVTMHFKETLILGIALMQRLLNDFQSLYPNILLLIIAHGLSAILVFLVIRKIFDSLTGLVCYFFFVSCFWPYMYILQGAHPPLVLMNFLLAVLFLLHAPQKPAYTFLSGLSLGLMVFSSPTSPAFLFYYLGAFMYAQYHNLSGMMDIKKFFIDGVIVLAGVLVVALLFLWPDGIESLQGYKRFLKFSQRGNNFVIYQEYLAQFFPVEDFFRGSGWGWILQYLFLTLPVLFSLYILSLIYLVKLGLKNPKIFFVILLSFSGLFIIELSAVAQLGRNYFPWLVGIMLLVSFCFYVYKNSLPQRTLPHRKIFFIFVSLVLWAHIAFNAYIFIQDIFPSRLATSFIHNWCVKHNIPGLYNYNYHPRNKNFAWFLNNPKQKTKIAIKGMETIKDIKEGYILIPPITGKTIYNECREGDFAGDPYLTELVITNELSKFTVASFKTLASSRFWNLEEEICAYRDLILKQVSPEDRQKGHTLILDANKLQKEWFAKR